MATAKIITTMETKIYLELTVTEAGALEAICGYGPDEFLKWFHRNLGEHYIRPYEKGLKSLFTKARKLGIAIKNAEDARKKLVDITID